MSDSTLNWHEQADVLGVRVRVYFFNPAEVDARTARLDRHLPILAGSGAHVLGTEGQRDCYRVPGLMAQPDAVYQHGNGLLCLSQRGADGRLHRPGHWLRHWRADLMLQSLAAAMAVAGQTQKPTAALWRGANVLCQFDPSPLVLDGLASQIDAARRYWNEPDYLIPAQLASFCEPRLRAVLSRPGATDPADTEPASLTSA